jgi:hypothetical protein
MAIDVVEGDTATGTSRGAKRTKDNVQKPKHSSGGSQALTVAGAPPAAPPAAQLRDPSGKPVSQKELDDMVVQWANHHGKSIDQAKAELTQTTSPEAFIASFYSMLNNKQEAWKEPEQELDFLESVDGWKQDELDLADL